MSLAKKGALYEGFSALANAFFRCQGADSQGVFPSGSWGDGMIADYLMPKDAQSTMIFNKNRPMGAVRA
jgi:hypothetical protein